MWYQLQNAADVASPAVLVCPDRIEANVRRMIAMAGGPHRLCPHVKAHKLREIVRLQLALGIEHFKCATIAEAEMTAGCGAPAVLFAYQPAGPNVARLLDLMAKFPATRFAAIVDNAASAREISVAAHARGACVDLLVDLDCGMHRTGIAPDRAAFELYGLMATLPGIAAAGLHTYDGHIHDRDTAVRAAKTQAATAPVHALRAQLGAPRLVIGGTPTFPMHACSPDVQCSPGTCVLWDGWSAAWLADMAFESAAVVMTRVVSKPATNRLCLDLGHKAIAAEMPPPRVQLFGLTDAVPLMHSEEHLVIETPRAAEFSVGDVLYGIPWHICPTMALHARVAVVRAGRMAEQWNVIARDRALSI